MKYSQLLGQQLKSHDVIDLIECDDLDVIYSFDRFFENQPDEYRVSSKSEGIQMRFDENQTLDTVFFYIIAGEDFSPCNIDSLGAPVFASLESARDYANQSDLSVTEGATSLFDVPIKWIRIEFGSHLHHSEFRDGMLHRITLSLPNNG